MNPRMKLCFNDRVGIVADISQLIADQGLNIVSMEVIRRNDQAHVYLELEKDGINPFDARSVLEMFRQLSDVLEYQMIDFLPHEERNNRFKVVLDNISDGVLSIDHKGNVTTINHMACKALNVQAEDILGKKIDTIDLNLTDYPILKCLTGVKVENARQELFSRNGRYQYISTCRPIRDAADRVIGAVEIAKDVKEIKKLAQCLSEPKCINFSDIIGNHQAITTAIAFAQKIAVTDTIVTIQGASGTGKELFARAIHAASGRPGPFVPVNCAALPEHLLESELFGYVGGAFTGGKKQGAAGLFEIAQNGTVFLDEIAEMPLSAQAKLLRLIQEKAVRRIGASQEISIDARLITATNKSLEQMVESLNFRQDLYYRISVLPIHIPPLKARKNDIPLLVEHFLFQVSSRLGTSVPCLTPQAMEKLFRHDWPGNVRELKNVIDRAALLSNGPTIDVDYIWFSYELNGGVRPTPYDVMQDGSDDTNNSLKAKMENYEQELICRALAKACSVRAAARSMQISHPALLKKIRKYNLKIKNN
jgi:PAS domain S-box-containing protein